MRFIVQPTEEGFKIWDTKIERFYRNNGKELVYKKKGKADRRCDICNRNWPS